MGCTSAIDSSILEAESDVMPVAVKLRYTAPPITIVFKVAGSNLTRKKIKFLLLGKGEGRLEFILGLV